MKIKLVIADDHEMVRRGVRAILTDSDVDVVGEAASGDDLLALLGAAQADVLLLDVRMPRGDGLHVLQRLRERNGQLAVLMYSAFDNPAYEAKAMALGAHGYLLKSASSQQVLEAIRAVAQGHRTWTRTDHRRLSGYSASAEPHSAGETPLTPREAEVLIALTEGKTNKEISEQLHISTETVKEHVQHVLRKLGVADRTQAAVWAVRQGLV